MRKGGQFFIVCLAPFFLSGCIWFDRAGFVPFASEITDRPAFDAALKTCVDHVSEYQQRVSITAIFEGTAAGALSNAPSAAVPPATIIVPVVGGIAGGMNAFLSGLDLLGINDQKIIIKCMEKKGDQTGKWLVLDPNA